MAGKVYNKTKLQGLGAVATNLFADLKLAGFTQVLPAAAQPFTLTSGKGTFVMDSAAAFNPLNAVQPWRLLLDVTDSAGTGAIKIAIANPQQISNTGQTTTFPGAAADTSGIRVMGKLGTQWTPTAPSLGASFMTRNMIANIYDSGTTYSYLLVVTNHGVAFKVWEDASDSKPNNSWFLVQSPVDKLTGAPLITDNSPIFCVYSCDSAVIQKFVISEADVFRPTDSVSAEVDSVNSSAIINGKDQVAIAKGNKYLVTFPNRLNTDRYAYTEELDMIAYTSADVIAEETEIPVTVYGESTPRVYRALKANLPNNAGMRLLFLVEGGGVPAA